MPRFGRASLRALVALAALGTFVIAGSQAQAARIDSLLRGSISAGNGSYVGHLGVPVLRVQPAHNPVVHLPPGGHPHPGGVKK
jgi:hypothetical protein